MLPKYMLGTRMADGVLPDRDAAIARTGTRGATSGRPRSSGGTCRLTMGGLKNGPGGRASSMCRSSTFGTVRPARRSSFNTDSSCLRRRYALSEASIARPWYTAYPSTMAMGTTLPNSLLLMVLYRRFMAPPTAASEMPCCQYGARSRCSDGCNESLVKSALCGRAGRLVSMMGGADMGVSKMSLKSGTTAGSTVTLSIART
mmetsp:Transcript_5975/g.19507  ORF Transcript_5975/g.19507 Transcript_5975/m.19507 type:complete len:202 (-) Transcript_5975:177-782(-)